MKQYILIGTLLLCGFTQVVNGQARPDLALSNQDLTLLETADFLIIKEDRKITITSDDEVILRVDRSILLMEEGEELQLVLVEYDASSKVTSFSGAVYDERGNKLHSYKMKDAYDQALIRHRGVSDDQVMAQYFESNTYPCVIEYSYEVEMGGISKLRAYNWNVLSAYGIALQNGMLQVEYPLDQEVELLLQNLEATTKRQALRKSNLIEVSFSNIEAFKREFMSEPWPDVVPSIWLFPSEFRVENYNGDFTSWEGFGRFMRQLMDADRNMPTSLQHEVQRLAGALPTDREKIEVLYKHMQGEMRYVSIQLGIGGWKPMPVADVYEKKYGDCKALTVYMQSMLESVGIESHPVLIRRGETSMGELHAELPVNFFNHVILYIPSEEMYLECTSGNYPPGFIGSDNENRKALLLKPEGGELIDMPVSSANDNLNERIVLVELKEDGSGSIAVQQEMFGHHHQYYRYLDLNYSEEEQLDAICSKLQLPVHVLEEWSLVLDSNQARAEMNIAFDVTRYGVKAGSRLFFPLQFLSIISQVPDPIEQRIGAFRLNHSDTNRESLHISFPDGYQIEAMPIEQKVVESQFGIFSLNVEVVDEGIVISQEFQRLAGEWAPDQYEAYRQFLMEASHLMKDQIVLVQIRP